MRSSRIKAKLRRREAALLTTLHFTDPSVFEMTSLLGFDGIWMDLEHHAYGVETASERYFGKSVRDLNLAEAATLAALPKDAKIVFMCHHGMRSRAAAERFLAEGFKNIYNLEGGIDAWSQRVDSKVPRY
jgi:rhodanese-related sulfurtransferase